MRSGHTPSSTGITITDFPPSSGSSICRSLIPAQRQTTRQISALHGVAAREAADLLCLQYPEALATAKGIDNERQLLRRESLGPYTGTQRFLRILEKERHPHRPATQTRRSQPVVNGVLDY
ncbi:hypothetical protein E4U35_005133 [Claviceps purpurea]|nr:hypothetical protein E4U35_005133 [Claviceps purpurea]KAG6238248.1 hypothetical protein E4U25_001862 [Claviceps purpurea]